MVVGAGERRAAVTARPAFEVDGQAYRWDAVLRWGELSGELAELERETQLGVAALAEDGAPPADDVRVAGATFRYQRGLLAADELEAWLARFGLTATQWLDHVRRTIARERRRGSELRSPAGSIEDAVWADAVCSGALERWARELASRLAVAPGAAPEAGLEAAYTRFRERVVTDEAVAREIESRRLEWLRVDGELLELENEDVAREVAFCAREDGESLAELAARTRTELRLLAAFLDDVEPELAAALLGAREGEVLGPVAVGGRFVVAVLRSKAPPSPQDPELRARAAEHVLRRALERELESRVRWHEHL